MPDPNTIPFREADGNGHYKSKQLPNDRADFLEGLGLPTFAGDVVSASTSGTVGGEVTTFWGTDGHTIKADGHTGLAKLATGILSTVPAPVGDVVGTTDVQTLLNKTIINPVLSGVTGMTKYDVGLGNVDNTSDVNKPISNSTQAALNNKEDKANKGVSSGYASLDTAGKVPMSQVPDAIIGASRYQGTWNAATNVPTIPAASLANQGYYYSVAVGGSTSIDGISTWVVGDTIISNGSIWQKIPVANLVQSVNGKTGIVVVNQNDVGLGNVTNTSDATKNSAIATLTNKTIDGANNTLNVRLNTTDVSGSLPVNKLNGGTNASSGTFWRGDGQWVSPTGAGDVVGPGSAVDGSVALFNGATGKAIRSFSGASGFAKLDTAGIVTTQTQMLAGDVSAAMISGQTEKTALVDPEDLFLEVDKATGLLRCIRAKRFSALPVNYITGFILQNNATDATNDINVTPGKCRDATDSVDIVLNTGLTKQLDAVWAAGNGAGMRDSTVGALTDTWWHIWVIYNATTGAVDVWTTASGNLSSPVLPSGWTHRRRIGAIQRAGGVIKQFRQLGGEYFSWNAPIFEGNDVQQVAGQSGYIGASVPTGMKMLGNFVWRGYGTTGGSVWCMRDPDSDVAGGIPNVCASVANVNSSTCGVALTDALSRLGFNITISGGTTHFFSTTIGYWDPRGRDGIYVY
jgi:hypothetical protein